MERVLQYHIPELHPLVVHFPVALLVTAAGAAVMWMWRGTAFWRKVTWLLIFLGTVTAYFAYQTGEVMEEQSEGVPIVEELVDLHEDMAMYTMVASLTATVLLGLQWFRMRTRSGEPDALAARLSLGLLVIVVACLVAWTGHIGATMVWGIVP